MDTTYSFYLGLSIFQGFQQDGNANDSLYIQLEKAITDAANARREAFREALKRAKAEKELDESICWVTLMSTFV